MKLLEHELLGYPRYIIYQEEDVFRFTVDSLLLSSFVEIKQNTKNIIDLGTGNAVVPIYLTLKTKANIYGVEIQKRVYDLGLKSVKKNKLEKQITLINDDLINLPKTFKEKAFDIVTCNPPYFKYNKSSNINKNDYLTIARHEVLTNIKEVIKTSYKLLKDKSSLFLIHRPERLVEIMSLMKELKIEPKKIRFVYPKKDKKANHVLIEGIKNAKPGSLKVLAPLYLYKDGKLTNEVYKIYNLGREDYASK